MTRTAGHAAGEVWTRPDDPTSPGTLLATRPHSDWAAQWVGHSYLLTEKKAVRQVRIVPDGDGVGFEVGPKLVAPGKRFDIQGAGGQRVGDKEYLCHGDAWFEL